MTTVPLSLREGQHFLTNLVQGYLSLMVDDETLTVQILNNEVM